MRALSVLVADDDDDQRTLLGRMVEALGHQPLFARNGREAVSAFTRDDPDVVLLDLSMPVMDGHDAASEIRRRAERRWVPILLVTATEDEPNLARGLAAGGDWYLSKPVSLPILGAKLSGLARTIEAERRLARQKEELLEYRRRAEDEARLARSVLLRPSELERELAGRVRSWIGPAERFSGDVVVAARAPAGGVFVMLADGIGHGLVPALVVLPLTRTFRTMVKKGFTLASLVEELNRSLRDIAPPGKFVASTVAAFHPEGGMLEVWNGGNPPALLVNGENEICQRFVSRHLPLGILAPEAFDARVEIASSAAGGQLVLVSDGVTEFETSGGERLGVGGVEAILEATAARGRLHALSACLGGAARHDDCSVLILDCVGAACAGRWPPPAPARPADAGGESGPIGWQLSLRLEASSVRCTDVVPILQSLIGQLVPRSSTPERLHVVLSELYNNALDHGLLGLDSSMKDGPAGFEGWAAERAARLARLSEGYIEISVAFEHAAVGKRLRLTVTDSGAGFDSDALLRRMTVPESAHGRGTALARSFCESFNYESGGRTAVAVCAT